MAGRFASLLDAYGTHFQKVRFKKIFLTPSSTLLLQKNENAILSSVTAIFSTARHGALLGRVGAVGGVVVWAVGGGGGMGGGRDHRNDDDDDDDDGDDDDDDDDYDDDDDD